MSSTAPANLFSDKLTLDARVKSELGTSQSHNSLTYHWPCKFALSRYDRPFEVACLEQLPNIQTEKAVYQLLECHCAVLSISFIALEALHGPALTGIFRDLIDGLPVDHSEQNKYICVDGDEGQDEKEEEGGADVGSRSRESRCWVTGRIVTGIISGQDLGEEALSTRSAGDQQAACPSREASAA